MINWTAANTPRSYCLSKKSHHKVRVTSHHFYYSMLKCPPPARIQSRRRWRHSSTANSI